jgi:hypothetical protein
MAAAAHRRAIDDGDLFATSGGVNDCRKNRIDDFLRLGLGNVIGFGESVHEFRRVHWIALALAEGTEV